MGTNTIHSYTSTQLTTVSLHNVANNYVYIHDDSWPVVQAKTMLWNRPIRHDIVVSKVFVLPTGYMSCVCPGPLTTERWHLNVKLSFCLQINNRNKSRLVQKLKQSHTWIHPLMCYYHTHTYIVRTHLASYNYGCTHGDWPIDIILGLPGAYAMRHSYAPGVT